MSNPESSILPAYNNTFIIFMKYYFFIAIICGLAYILYKYVIKRFINVDGNNTLDAGTDTIKPNEEASELKLTSNTNIKDQIYYLYWTGGFDSTFRLCEMLINERKIVQPIYVSLVLDNNCETEETCNKLWVRRNRKYEKRAMLEIRKLLNSKYPATLKRLLPTLYIDKDIEDVEFNQAFEAKFYANNLWPGKRRKHQYLFLSKYAYYHKIYVDIGVLGIHDKQALAQFLKQHLKPISEKHELSTMKNTNVNKEHGKKIINYGIDIPGHYLEYLRFPLFGRTKEQLLLKARNYGYEDILKKTWSCWFPNPASGKPCGKCPMCKERIVTHPN